jgi:NTE family protein
VSTLECLGHHTRRPLNKAQSAEATNPGEGFTLVLAGGGISGIAYHAGALLAMKEAGLDPRRADLVIGTSAGALVGAFLRSGCPLPELARAACGASVLEGGPVARHAWRSAPELLARGLGAGWVIGRSLVRTPWPAPPAALGRIFPGALAVARSTENIDGLPQEWPADPFWAVGLDLVSGQRVVLGRNPEDASEPLGRAVLASTAVPGVFAPVRFGTRVLVDGGVHSVSNLDLAALHTSRVVVCVSPLAFDPDEPPGCLARIVRAKVQSDLNREARRLRGIHNRHVVLLRPGKNQLRRIPLNFLRSEGLETIQHEAYQRTLTQLQQPHGVEAIARASAMTHPRASNPRRAGAPAAGLR